MQYWPPKCSGVEVYQSIAEWMYLVTFHHIIICILLAHIKMSFLISRLLSILVNRDTNILTCIYCPNISISITPKNPVWVRLYCSYIRWSFTIWGFVTFVVFCYSLILVLIFWFLGLPSAVLFTSWT